MRSEGSTGDAYGGTGTWAGSEGNRRSAPATFEQLSRRRIYYNRLLGDFRDQSKDQPTRSAPFSRVIRFLAYAVIAALVIVLRSSPGELNAMNSGLRVAIETRPFNPSEALPRYFHSINQVREVPMWIANALLPQVEVGLPYGNLLSLMSYSRIIPQGGVCASSASLRLTLRMAGTTTDYEKTTTKVFQELYREAWEVQTVQSGASYTPGELTTPLNASFPFTGDASSKLIPKTLFGKDKHGEDVDPEEAQLEHGINVNWYYMPEDSKKGFHAKGGYVAIWTLGTIKDDALLPDSAFVHLLAPGQFPLQEPQNTLNVCMPERVSAVMRAEDFLFADFFGTKFASIVIDFVVYNANYQSLSDVSILFDANAAGIITQKKIDVTTIKMDGGNDMQYVQWLEVVYLFGTLFYFFDLGFQSWKNYKKAIRDIWTYCNLASILFSLTSISTWQLYVPLMSTFLVGNDFQDYVKVAELQQYFQWYTRISAIAVFSILVRFLEFVANSRPRVRLLLRAMGMSSFNMAIYVSYVGVILIGFWSLALIAFGSHTASFGSMTGCFINCFSMFNGKIEVMDTVDNSSPFKVPFLLGFTLFFSFISVQMFNAIINYSYNRVSESMEPQFERERQERKCKEMQRKRGKKPNIVRRCFDQVMRLWKGKEAAEEKVGAKPEVADQAALPAASDMPALDNITDPGMRQRVEGYWGKEKLWKPPEGFFSCGLFFLLMACYISFLYFNLSVASSSSIQNAVMHAIKSTEVENSLGQTMTINEVRRIEDMAVWINEALPRTIFDSTDSAIKEFAENEEIFLPGTTCIATWNCLVTGYEKAGETSSVKIARMTVRRVNAFLNTGTTIDENITEYSNFIGGAVDPKTGTIVPNLDGAQKTVTALAHHRRTPQFIEPATSPSDELEATTASDSFNATLDGEVFCRLRAEGEGGYHNFGGIECLLDANKDSFMKQLDALKDGMLFSMRTACVAIEFVLINGNARTLSYSTIMFVVNPSGLVTSTQEVKTILLMNWQNFNKDSVDILLRLLPGMFYLGLVAYSMYTLLHDLLSEWYRKKVNEGIGRVQTTIEFFTLDMFNMLDIISITISSTSFVLYIAWLVKEQEMRGYGVQPGSEIAVFYDYCRELSTFALVYNQMSAINMMIIFVRPLKFFRENPRMAKLNQTLWDSTTDSVYFVFVFAVCLFAFVIYAHIAFGAKVTNLSTFLDAMDYCFFYIMGKFDFYQLYDVDAFMAILFFFPFLLLFYCVFTNIFFAIIDRNFVTAEPPPFNLKRTFKPVFGRVLRFIEWDEDYDMEDDPTEKKKSGPQTRRGRVQAMAAEIDEILQGRNDKVLYSGPKSSKLLNEVCDMDDKMGEVVHWCREEAKKFNECFQRFFTLKQDPKNAKGEEGFIKNEVMQEVSYMLKQESEEMDVAERQKRYAIQVHEKMAMRDQETLSQYIVLLEKKIKKRMVEKKSLRMEVHHLRSESESMRFTTDDLRKRSETDAGQAGAAIEGQKDTASRGASAGRAGAPTDEGEDSDSDEDSKDGGPQAPAGVGKENGSAGKANGSSETALNLQNQLALHLT